MRAPGAAAGRALAAALAAALGAALAPAAFAQAPSTDTVEFRLIAATAQRHVYVAPQYLERKGTGARGVFLDSFPEGRRMPRNVMVGSAVQVIGTRCDAPQIWTESSLLRVGPGMTGGMVGLTTTRSATAKVVPGSIAAFQQAVLCGDPDALTAQQLRVRLEHPDVPATLTVRVEDMRGVR
jgi:hypothetical protein